MRVAIYVRVSTERQAQALTIEQQLTRLQEYCQAQKWELHPDQIFRDDGYSGTNLNRPGLDRLRDQVGRRSFDRVLLTAPDRLARNYVHQMLLIEEMEKAGCLVEFIDHPMSRDPHDQLLLQIRGSVAEYERNLIVERMRRGRQQKFRAGTLLPWTGRPPYGYRTDPVQPRDPKGVRLEESEAAVVAEIFNYYLEEDHSLSGLAKHLMKQGITSPGGLKRWSQVTLGTILRNPVYLGTVYAGRTQPRPLQRRYSPLKPVGRSNTGDGPRPVEEWILVAHIPPIVSQELFEMVQSKLAHNKQLAQRNNTAHPYPYLLRCLLSCGACQRTCTGRKQGKYSYYACAGKQPAFQSCRDERCRTPLIRSEQLDQLVWEDVCEVLLHPESIQEALNRAQGGSWLPQELVSRRENLGKARTNLVRQTERLTEAYLGGVLELEEYKRRHQELVGRQEAIANQLRELEGNVNRQVELSAVSHSIEEFCERVREGLLEADFVRKRQLAELLIDRVIVNGEEVEIRYVVPTSKSSETVRFCHLRKDYFKSALQSDPEINFRSKPLKSVKTD
jgi:site-specific DNA recombinase